MAVNKFLAKIILRRDIHKDLAFAEKEASEAHGKYNNACQAISVFEEKMGVLNESLNTSKQEMTSLQSEKESIDTLLLQLLNNEELYDAKTILEDRLDDQNTLLRNLTEKLLSSQKEHKLILNKLGKLKEERALLEQDVDNLAHEIELMKEKSKRRESAKEKREEIMAQRKKIRDNLLTLKNEWKETLYDFKTKAVDADNLKSLEGLERELKDYEKLVNNAIEIAVK